MSFTASLNASVSLLDFPDNKLEVGGGEGGQQVERWHKELRLRKEEDRLEQKEKDVIK